MPTYEPNYVVGRGRLYFDKFKKGSNNSESGELYFGNSPEFTLTTDSETLDHYSSEHGLREMDASVLLELTQGGNFTVDEINADNLALFFLGEKSTITQTQATDRKETFELIKKGRYYQLGADEVTPSGVRNITNFQIVVAAAGTSISTGSGDITSIPGATPLPSDQYEIEVETGRLYIEPDAANVPGAGMTAAVQYDVDAQTRTIVIGKSDMIYGALRFLSDNPVGTNKDYFFPKVALQPDGDYALKGDDWQVMSFSFRAMKKNSNLQRLYIDIHDESSNPAPVPATYTITSSPASTTSAAGTPVNVTFTVRDQNNQVVSGKTVNFSANSGATVTPTTGSTNASGQIVVALNRAAAGSGTVTGTVQDGGATNTSTAVTFS